MATLTLMIIKWVDHCFSSYRRAAFCSVYIKTLHLKKTLNTHFSHFRVEIQFQDVEFEIPATPEPIESYVSRQSFE